MRILCNVGGEFVFKHNKIHYQGGETGLLVVDESICTYLDLLSRVNRIFPMIESDGLEIKYRYPGSEVDDPLVLVTLRNDDDIHNMSSLHTVRSSFGSMTLPPPPPPVQLYLFQTSDQNQLTATKETPMPFRKGENASIKIEETLKEKQSSSSSDKFNEIKRRPKLDDTEWITGIAKARIERNLPCEEKDIMDEIRNEYGFDVDYYKAWTCRNRALRELGHLLQEAKKDEAKKEEVKKEPLPYMGYTPLSSNMRNGHLPPPPPPFPDLHIYELRRDVSGIQAFLVVFRRHAMILQVVLLLVLLLLLHYETSKK